MAIFQFYKEQKIPTSIDQIWDFISAPKNLKRITPDYMGFDINSSQLSNKMYAGMMISYTVKPIFGIKMNWVTEITQVQEKAFFIDEQRFGPYKFWYHQHHFKEIDKGVEMQDIVSYALPFDPISRPLNELLVGNKVKKIFEFREEVLKKMF